MAQPRTPLLVFIAILHCVGLVVVGHTQDAIHPVDYPNSNVGAHSPGNTSEFAAGPVAMGMAGMGYPQTQWNPTSQGFYGPGSTQVSHFMSDYAPQRIDSARRTAVQYRLQTSQLSPILADLANTNASLAEQWAELAEKINDLSHRNHDAQGKYDVALRDYKDVGANLNHYGLTPSMGLLLSHKKSQLEDWQIASSAAHRVDDEIQRSRERQLQNEVVTYDGSDVQRQTSDILARSGQQAARSGDSLLVSQIQTLLRERNHWLQSLTRGYNEYRQKLGELDAAAMAFAQLTSEYRQLINRHVTWIRSIEPLGVADARKFRTGLASLFDARRSEDFGYSLTQKWKSNPANGMTLVGTVLIIFLVRILTKNWLLGIGKRKRMVEASPAARKVVASLLTPLLTICFPSILYLIARWLGSGFVTESILHVSSGLYAASFVALLVEVPRQLLRTNGFVERHLKIDLPRRQRAAVYLLLIGTGLVLSAYVVTLAGVIDHGIWSGSVSRIGFIASLLLVAWTAHLALKPSGGFLEPLVAKFAGEVLYRVRFLFYIMGVGFPLAMMVLSALGYQFTATEMIRRAGLMYVSILIGATLWAAVKIIASWVWHSLTGTRDERQVDEFDRATPARVSGVLAEQALELKHQMAFLSQCGLTLAAFIGIAWLWADIFPNFRMGNAVLWHVEDSVAQSVIDASGQKVQRAEIKLTAVTALHLVLAGAALFVAFQLAKLLPSIFDVLVLQRVSFDEAMEHLSLVLGRCLLFGAGCIVACRLVGLRWETIQWLAVGLTIGLGFALQDLMRNLFGGLVVLFEKPARLGDLITVGNVTGRVAAQKLRTTVLSDEEGREVIVPNKNFVSQDVVNWMGAGRLQAIPIEVAVTRDERPADICRKLQQLLVEQPDVVLSPAPQATLVCISQSYQRIELRAWVEEDQDPARCRESLKQLVLNYLTDKQWLAANQPRQPLLKESRTADGSRSAVKRSA